MGWVLHHYDNSLGQLRLEARALRHARRLPRLSTVVYLRLAWSYLEPEEGRFDWSVVDTPAQRWIAQGKKIALRFSACESGPRRRHAALGEGGGREGLLLRAGKGVVPRRRPPLGAGLRRPRLPGQARPLPGRRRGPLRRRPRTWPSSTWARSAIWGEGHTFGSTKRNVPRGDGPAPHRPVRKHFKKTLLAANDDFAEPRARRRRDPTTRARAGLTLRDDSILVQSRPHAYYQRGHGAARSGRAAGDPGDRALRRLRGAGRLGRRSLYLKAVEDYHASYASIHWWPREFLGGEPGARPTDEPAAGLPAAARRGELAGGGAAPAALHLHRPLAQRGNRAVPARGEPRGHAEGRSGGIVAVVIDSGLDVARCRSAARGGQAVARESPSACRDPCSRGSTTSSCPSARERDAGDRPAARRRRRPAPLSSRHDPRPAAPRPMTPRPARSPRC